jgi:AsmA protein
MVGPVGKMPGMGPVAVDITMKAFGELAASLKGKVVDAAVSRRFDFDLAVSPFSPRRLMESMGRKFPVATADPEVLKKFSIAMHISGDPSKLNITNGKMELDSSKMDFNASLSEFDRPKASFNMGLDAIDIDRYMPPASEDKKEARQAQAPAGQNKAKSDYSALRKPVIEGTFKAGSIKMKGVKAENILLTLDARDGLFQIKPLKMDLYKGNMALTAQYDVRKDTPGIVAQLKAAGIQARPLLSDMAGKDFIEGTANVTADIRTIGEDPMVIKQNLDGAGEILFKDGAIVGIDLAGMLRNLKVSFGLEKQTGEKPRTDFSELRVPFKIEKGVASTEGTSISSPLLRVSAAGTADLVKETLDFRVEPKVVGTLKGQGDAKDRSGLMVPVLVKGTFASPSFAPDLEGLLKQGLDKALTDPTKLKDQLKELKPDKGVVKPPEGMKLNLPTGR